MSAAVRRLPLAHEVTGAGPFYCARLSASITTTVCLGRQGARTQGNSRRDGWELYPTCARCPEGRALARRVGDVDTETLVIQAVDKVASAANGTRCAAPGCPNARAPEGRVVELLGFCHQHRKRAYVQRHHTGDSYAQVRAWLLGRGR